MDNEIDWDAYFNSEKHKQFLVEQHKRNELVRQQERAFQERVAKLDKANALMEFLEIPVIPVIPGNMGRWHEVYAVDLYDILMDEEKLKVLVSKLRNKALW